MFIQKCCLVFPSPGKDSIFVFLYTGTKRGSNLTSCARSWWAKRCSHKNRRQNYGRDKKQKEKMKKMSAKYYSRLTFRCICSHKKLKITQHCPREAAKNFAQLNKNVNTRTTFPGHLKCSQLWGKPGDGQHTNQPVMEIKKKKKNGGMLHSAPNGQHHSPKVKMCCKEFGQDPGAALRKWQVFWPEAGLYITWHGYYGGGVCFVVILFCFGNDFWSC